MSKDEQADQLKFQETFSQLLGRNNASCACIKM